MTKPRKGNSTAATQVADITLENLFEKLEKLEEKIATKECISTLMEAISNQKEVIAKMEDKIAILESRVDHLAKSNDEVEQYQRRLCLRINGIDLPSNGDKETSEDCLAKVENVFKKLGLSIPPDVIDRAHRVGREISMKGKKVRSMIVRFTTFRHRSIVYRARKNSSQYKIKLDLTRLRIHLVKQANEKLEGRADSHAFCDLNCRPCWFDQGTYKYFNDIETFEKLFHTATR